MFTMEEYWIEDQEHSLKSVVDDEDTLKEKEDEESEEMKEEVEEPENLEELEEIDAQLEKGDEVLIAELKADILPKSRLVFRCPRCKKIYLHNKWVKDTITDLYLIKTELAYCNKCLGKTFDNFVGSIEIYDKKLDEHKEQIIELARQVERELEDAPPFEKIIQIIEKNDILFIFTNTTRLAREIGRRLRQELQGGIQYEWFERNQYLRVKWYDEVDNRNYFKERIRALKERRFGMFAFEDAE